MRKRAAFVFLFVFFVFGYAVAAEEMEAVIIDENSDGAVSAGDKYSINYREKKSCGRVTQEEVDYIINAGFDKNQDGNVQVVELQNFWQANGFQVSLRLETPADPAQARSVSSEIIDLNQDGLISVGDIYNHRFDSLAVATGIIKEENFEALDIAQDGVTPMELELIVERATIYDWSFALNPPELEINTVSYFPLKVGNQWNFVREGYPDQKSWIELIELQGKGLHFRKNNLQTYWGPGSPNAGLSKIGWYEGYLVMGDGNFYNYLDDSPDHWTYDWNGNLYASIWFVGKGDLPPYFIFPEILEVETILATNQDYYIQFADGRVAEYNGNFSIRYSWAYVDTPVYQGISLRISCDEIYWDSEARYAVYEDWYFVEGIGPVQIEQYNDPDRTGLTIRIQLESYMLLFN